MNSPDQNDYQIYFFKSRTRSILNKNKRVILSADLTAPTSGKFRKLPT